MIGLIRSEILKLRTTNVWWAMLLGLAALTALSLLANLFQANALIESPGDLSGPPGDQGGEGIGGGYGFTARPVGAFVIRGDQVEWRPALDVGRVILGGQLVAAIALLVLRSLLRRRP